MPRYPVAFHGTSNGSCVRCGERLSLSGACACQPCACGSTSHAPGSCDYCRESVAEHLARQLCASCKQPITFERGFACCTECGDMQCRACAGERDDGRCPACADSADTCASCGEAMLVSAMHQQRDELDGYLLDGVYRCEACCGGRCGERDCAIASAS